MIYNYDNIDTPDFFKEWKEAEKQNNKKEKINFAYYIFAGLITFLSIIGMFTILALIEMI